MNADETPNPGRLWEQDLLPKGVQDHLRNLMYKAETAHDLYAFAMVGPCPNCGDELTYDGDDAGFPIEDEGDTTIGLCLKCGYRWCLDCRKPLLAWPCAHWGAWESYREANEIVSEDVERYYEWLEAYVASSD